MQERPEDVPTGDLPRSMQLIADRRLVGQVAPGTRVTAYAIYSVYQVRHNPPPCSPPSRNAAFRAVGILASLAGGDHPTLFHVQSKQQPKDQAGVAIRVPYLRIVGLDQEDEGAHSTPTFT